MRKLPTTASLTTCAKSSAMTSPKRDLTGSANDFIATLGFLKETYSATFHLVGNQLGQWYEDHYEGETYCIASHIYEKDGQGRKLDMAIRYQERVEYIDGRYCYTRRDVNIVWSSDQSLHQ
jgi:hypothetical protein